MLVLSLALMALLGFVAPPDVFAQAAAPTPKATITGFIDNVGTFTQNLSSSDLNWGRNRDQQTYGRTRGRFDIVGEVGQAKAVFGFEIDAYWGQTGFSDTTSIGKGEPCFTTGTNNAITCGTGAAGAESSFDINTDTRARSRSSGSTRSSRCAGADPDHCPARRPAVRDGGQLQAGHVCQR